MMNLWTSGGNSVVTFPPSRDDLFVAVLVAGQVALFWPITDYDRAVRAAETLTRAQHRERPYVVKVIPVTAKEAQTLGLLPENLFEGMTPEKHAEIQQRTYDTCMEVLRTSTDPVTREDAIELLRSMGALR